MNSAALPSLFERLDAALPQTQCTRCGYPDCAAYAHAIADGTAPINQCPPGGAEGIARLAAITGQSTLPLNAENGVEAPRTVAVIDETWCIGCTLCLPVCPTDAIFGSNKAMHSVIEPHCTGCALCLPVCPVDCISLLNVTGDRSGWAAWSDKQAQVARHRYEIHQFRRADSRSGNDDPSGNSGEHPVPSSSTEHRDASNEPKDPAGVSASPESEAREASGADANARKRSVIDSALARARALRKS